jgi:hypothetical protein
VDVVGFVAANDPADGEAPRLAAPGNLHTYSSQLLQNRSRTPAAQLR